MLWVGSAVAAASAVGGYAAAFLFDVSIAGSMAVACGVLFALALAFAPRRGLVAQARRRNAQRLDLGLRMLVVHLLHHQETEAESEECRVPGLHRHLRWSEARTRQVVREAEARALVVRAGGMLRATADGRSLADIAIVGETGAERLL
jgi:manganese/zinc/iron transport system permease protein